MNKDGDSLITKNVGGKSYTLPVYPLASWTNFLSRVIVQALLIPFIWLISILMLTPLRASLSNMIQPSVKKIVDAAFEKEQKALLHDVSGAVLHIGSRGGSYVQYCKSASHVVVVEPITTLHVKIRAEAKKSVTVVESIDNIDKSIMFDWVLLGNALYEVPDVSDTVKQLDSLLKPGGRIFFAEHAAISDGTSKLHCKLQDTINPMWASINGGFYCHNRETTAKVIQEALDWELAIWTYENFLLFMGPYALGIAAKPKEKEKRWISVIRTNLRWHTMDPISEAV